MQLAYSAFLVRDYDEAIGWFREALAWEVVEDSALGGGKRWVRIAPPGGGGELLLARADSPRQDQVVGRTAGGRVAYFLHSEDFDRDHARMVAAGVACEEAPRDEAYGRVAVFADLYGNRWDLVGPRVLPPTAGEQA